MVENVFCDHGENHLRKLRYCASSKSSHPGEIQVEWLESKGANVLYYLRIDINHFVTWFVCNWFVISTCQVWIELVILPSVDGKIAFCMLVLGLLASHLRISINFHSCVGIFIAVCGIALLKCWNFVNVLSLDILPITVLRWSICSFVLVNGISTGNKAYYD